MYDLNTYTDVQMNDIISTPLTVSDVGYSSAAGVVSTPESFFTGPAGATNTSGVFQSVTTAAIPVLSSLAQAAHAGSSSSPYVTPQYGPQTIYPTTRPATPLAGQSQWTMVILLALGLFLVTEAGSK